MAEDWVAAKNKTCLLSIRTLDLAEELAVVPLMAYSLAPRLSLPIATQNRVHVHGHLHDSYCHPNLPVWNII